MEQRRTTSINDPAVIQKLLGLKEAGDKHGFFTGLYEVVTENEDEVVNGDRSKLADKISAIEEMLEYFSGSDVEEYEKCAKLQPVLTRLRGLKESQATTDRVRQDE